MDINDLEKNAKNATKDPKTAIKYFIDCLYVYQQGDDDALGYLGYVLSKKESVEDESAPSGFIPSTHAMTLIKMVREPKNVNVLLGAMGATWENDYQDVDPDNYQPKYKSQQDLGDDTLKLFIKSGGQDLPFPIRVAKNKQGQWKIMEFSSIVTGVRPPKSSERDF